jgi:hypothetical protein
LAAVNVVVPLPAWVTEPAPEIALPTVIASLRLNASAALSVTLPEPKEPLVPPLPICNVPAVMVVAPVYVFAPVSVKVAAALFSVRVFPLPAIIPPKVLLDALV